MHPFRLLAAFELLRSSAATQYPLYSSDYIERHLATFLTPPEPGTKSCNKAASQIFPMTCSLSSNEKQCSFLVSAVPGRVDLGDYEEQYWSLQQSTTSPYCRVFPLSAEEVSIVIRVLKKFQCQFAVKSGGHAAFEGASNSEGGVTIDLVSLNEITTSEDQTVTSLGPGNRWIDVYRTLDLMNLSVVGGRVADIGVGGLTLGGGISFFSGRYGWACDNVVNYQVDYLLGESILADRSRWLSPTDPSAMSITTRIQICTLHYEEAAIISESSLDLTLLHFLKATYGKEYTLFEKTAALLCSTHLSTSPPMRPRIHMPQQLYHIITMSFTMRTLSPWVLHTGNLRSTRRFCKTSRASPAWSRPGPSRL